MFIVNLNEAKMNTVQEKNFVASYFWKTLCNCGLLTSVHPRYFQVMTFCTC